MRHVLITDPTRIPVPGGKLIEEFFGRVRTETTAFSLAHMIAPPGWGEPAQTPDFDELTIMIRGRMQIEIDGRDLDLAAGQAFFVERGATVRYANPFHEECEYWAVCMPAFAPDLAHRAE
jgi:mannose-6-phosphate isomerase-like protein (cupin superfamily)